MWRMMGGADADTESWGGQGVGDRPVKSIFCDYIYKICNLIQTLKEALRLVTAAMKIKCVEKVSGKRLQWEFKRDGLFGSQNLVEHSVKKCLSVELKGTKK